MLMKVLTFAAKETMESLSDFTPGKAQKIIDKLLDAPALLTFAMGSLRLDNLMQMYGTTLTSIKKTYRCSGASSGLSRTKNRRSKQKI